MPSRENVTALQGKTITKAILERVSDDEDYSMLALRFDDGVVFVLRSYDADGYQSWMDYRFKEGSDV